MEIREIQDKREWEGFLAGCQEKTFLHSWQWGEFQEAMRGKVWRFGLYSRAEGNAGLAAVALVVRVKARRGTFLLVPHGPVVKNSNEKIQISNDERKSFKSEILKILLGKLKEVAKEEGADFIRINPIWRRNEENSALFEKAGFRFASMQMHPEASWKLDISAPESALFSGMRKTTRYLVRQAEKNKDISVQVSADVKDIERFSLLHEKTSGRQSFTPFSKEYLEKEFNAFAKDDAVRLFFGTYKGEIAAASFVVFWSGIGFYHHAASLQEYAKLSIPYLLQWRAIQEAKRRGCVLYDFWGFVDPAVFPKHPWAGPTLFKMGFGGRAHEYEKARDFALGWKYWGTAFFEAIRKMKRGL